MEPTHIKTLGRRLVRTVAAAVVACGVTLSPALEGIAHAKPPAEESTLERRKRIKDWAGAVRVATELNTALIEMNKRINDSNLAVFPDNEQFTAEHAMIKRILVFFGENGLLGNDWNKDIDYKVQVTRLQEFLISKGFEVEYSIFPSSPDKQAEEQRGRFNLSTSVELLKFAEQMQAAGDGWEAKLASLGQVKEAPKKDAAEIEQVQAEERVKPESRPVDDTAEVVKTELVQPVRFYGLSVPAHLADSRNFLGLAVGHKRTSFHEGPLGEINLDAFARFYRSEKGNLALLVLGSYHNLNTDVIGSNDRATLSLDKTAHLAMGGIGFNLWNRARLDLLGGAKLLRLNIALSNPVLEGNKDKTLFVGEARLRILAVKWLAVSGYGSTDATRGAGGRVNLAFPASVGRSGDSPSAPLEITAGVNWSKPEFLSLDPTGTRFVDRVIFDTGVVLPVAISSGFALGPGFSYAFDSSSETLGFGDGHTFTPALVANIARRLQLGGGYAFGSGPLGNTVFLTLGLKESGPNHSVFAGSGNNFTGSAYNGSSFAEAVWRK